MLTDGGQLFVTLFFRNFCCCIGMARMQASIKFSQRNNFARKFVVWNTMCIITEQYFCMNYSLKWVLWGVSVNKMLY